ncbi:MAG: presenilin family intramembrane aspartyl protease [archaeon]
MKHGLRITIFLMLFFVLAQLAGLALVGMSIKDRVVNLETGETSLVHDETSLGPVPEFSGFGAFTYVVIGVAVGTLLVLLIIRFKKLNLWKIWFFLAVFTAMSISIGVLVKQFYVVFAIAFVLAALKILRPNVVIHNLTEVLMYAGIAVFLVQVFNHNVLWASLLLLAIAVYDFIAVFKSKHMVTMATFQADNKLFAGLFIPYVTKRTDGRATAVKTETSNITAGKKVLPKDFKPGLEERKNAVLGGGDIAFPLIYTGIVVEKLVVDGMTKASALGFGLIITLTTTIALALLFTFAQKDKFYPAMPIISAGCFVGYGMIELARFLL